MVKSLLLVEHEADVDGECINVLFHLLTQFLGFCESGGVFFCRDDDFGFGHSRVSAVDVFDILVGKGMMIPKGDRLYLPAMRFEVGHDLFWRCNTCQQHHVMALDRFSGHSLLVEDTVQVAVINSGEIQILEWEKVHCLGQHPKLHRFQILGAFGDDDDIGPVFSVKRFTQSAGGQQLVVDNQPVIVYQQYADARFHIPMLESVVEQDDTHIAGVFITCKMLYAALNTATYTPGNLCFIC